MCGHEIGEYATIAAGAVVTKNVKPHALMAGIPAKRIGWVCECGQVLNEDMICPDCGKSYECLKHSVTARGGQCLNSIFHLLSERRAA